MIKSSTSSLKYSNTGKLNQLHSFIDEYRTVVSRFIDLLWDQDKVAALLPKETTDLVQTWLTARMIQCAGKQASGIVRGTKVKQERRIYIQNKLTKEGQFRKAKKLQRIINQTNVSKPNILHVCPELDSRFVDIDLDNETIFDGWIHLSCIGDKTLLDIPFKKSSHFNKMLNKGSIKTGIRLSKKQITFMFDLPEVELKSSGETLGIDVGQTTVISCSDSQVSRVNFHGYDLASITRLLSRKKKGSKKFLACQAHRKNYINWSINQINFNGVKELKLENIRDMRKYKKTNRTLSHWTYTTIFSKLVSKCQELGVQVTYISPTYTSKRCSQCGWTRRCNRNGKSFTCGQCSLSIDSDLNASRNIAANLKPIGYKKRHLHNIKTGFWWSEEGEEPIVPVVQRILTS